MSGRPLSALIFDIRDGRIQTIYAVGNPDKLQALPRRPSSPLSQIGRPALS